VAMDKARLNVYRVAATFSDAESLADVTILADDGPARVMRNPGPVPA
jgi:hypothetical protein